MSEVKKILVVDDHFEMLEFLRSMLELSNHDYEVLAVPSAEEGLLEARQGNFDLLITDVRLPGMSGFDLVRRVKKRNLELPVIMITAYDTAQGQQEAKELGVHRYFLKPLDTDAVLAAVHTALYGEPVVLADGRTAVATGEIPTISDEVRKRLESLRVDTGATSLMLATTGGQVAFEAGSGHRLDLPQIAVIMARNLADSFLLAEHLDSGNPFTFQYHSGKTIELYSTNIGRDYFVAMFFNVASRRGRIGTIWVFVQRAIKDLLTMLPPLAASSQAQVQTKPLPESKPAPVYATEAVTPVPKRDESRGLHSGAPTPRSKEVEVVEETAVSASDEIVTEVEIDWSAPEASELAGLFDGETGGDDSIDLDAFWDDALSLDTDESVGGFSLEEAQRKGLIPAEFNLEEDTDRQD